MRSKTTAFALALVAGLALLAASGSVSAAGKSCGGIGGIACNAGEYCKKTPMQCHIADSMGVCTKKPDICTQDYRPVCGCNGKTYPNACMAANDGASVLHEGKCG
jgi:hypothetical protein